MTTIKRQELANWILKHDQTIHCLKEIHVKYKDTGW